MSANPWLEEKEDGEVDSVPFEEPSLPPRREKRSLPIDPPNQDPFVDEGYEPLDLFGSQENEVHSSKFTGIINRNKDPKMARTEIPVTRTITGIDPSFSGFPSENPFTGGKSMFQVGIK